MTRTKITPMPPIGRCGSRYGTARSSVAAGGIFTAETQRRGEWMNLLSSTCALLLATVRQNVLTTPVSRVAMRFASV